MDTLTAMRVFVRAVETGGLSAAGRALGMAPSSVSRRVSELEGALGTRLLQRTTRKLSLTETGTIYFERARSIVDQADAAERAVAEGLALPSGTLRVSAPASLARQHLAPAAAAFHTRVPSVSVVLSVTDRMVDIVGEGFDLAIRASQLAESSHRARKIGEAKRLVCASPAYLERAGRPEHPQELAQMACLTFRDHPGVSRWHFVRGAERVDVPVTGPLQSDNGEALAAAAIAGLGVVLLPEWLVGPEIASGRLVELLENFGAVPEWTPLYVVFPSSPYVPPKTRSFIDFLAARFSRKRAWTDPVI